MISVAPGDVVYRANGQNQNQSDGIQNSTLYFVATGVVELTVLVFAATDVHVSKKQECKPNKFSQALRVATITHGGTFGSGGAILNFEAKTSAIVV